MKDINFKSILGTAAIALVVVIVYDQSKKMYAASKTTLPAATATSTTAVK